MRDMVAGDCVVTIATESSDGKKNRLSVDQRGDCDPHSFISFAGTHEQAPFESAVLTGDGFDSGRQLILHKTSDTSFDFEITARKPGIDGEAFI